MANDPFFAKSRKRKRPEPRGNANSFKKRNSTTKPSLLVKAGKATKPRLRQDDDATPADFESDNGEVGGNLMDDDIDLRASDVDANESEEEDEAETPAQKRLRLAKLYLNSVKESVSGEIDAAEIDKELIASRLKQDVLQHSGKINLFIGHSIPQPSPSSSFLNPPTLITRGHRFTVTSAVVSEDAKYLYTSGKEGSIIKWDLRASSSNRIKTFAKVRPVVKPRGIPRSTRKPGKMNGKTDLETMGHTDEVLSLALSTDGKYLASAGKDRTIGVWDVETNVLIQNIRNHRDIVSDVKFRHSTHTLYTSSYDRTLKAFSISASPAHLETLFGHQDCVTSLDALRGELAISAGGMDKTVRYWKIVEESQLVFRGGGESKARQLLEGDTELGEGRPVEKPKGFIEGRIDCAAMLDNTTFLSGGDSGSISLWITTKKRPIFSWPQAHGLEDTVSEFSTNPSGISVRNPRWITALGALPYSDLFASGSWDSAIRLWKLEKGKSTHPSAPPFGSFSSLCNVHVPGFINSLQVLRPPVTCSLNNVDWAAGESPHTDPDILLVAGVGQEPRLGRWMTKKATQGGEKVKNAAYVFVLNRVTKAPAAEATHDKDEE